MRGHDRSTTGMSLGAYSIAIVGAYIAFLPLLQILLPLKVVAIAPHAATALLGTVAASGAVVAGLSNIGVGWLSDRTRASIGRRPWIIVGVIGVGISDAAIWRSQTVTALIVAFALFQLLFNMLFAPLLALTADRVPAARRGWASALVGLGKPVGTVVGAVVIGLLLTREGDRFLALGSMVLATILPFALWLRRDRPSGADRPIAAGDAASKGRHSGNFFLACLSRVCVVIAFTVAQLYLLFYLQTILPHSSARMVERGVTALAILFGVVSGVAGIVAGRWSDRIGRRKPFVVGSALVVGVAMAALAAASSWPATVMAYGVFAVGAGIHTAVEFAMVLDIIPNRDRAARDLGILNLSNIVPQIITPLAVTWMISLPGSAIQWAFGTAAIMAVVGAVLVALMRAVR